MINTCLLLQNQPTPVIPSANVSKKTKESLAQSRKKSQKTGQQLSNDNLFIVESVLKVILTKSDNKSSVKATIKRCPTTETVSH